MTWDLTLADADLREAMIDAQARDRGMRPSGGKPKRLGDAMKASQEFEHEQAWLSVREILRDMYIRGPRKEEYSVKVRFDAARLKYFKKAAAKENMRVTAKDGVLVFRPTP